MKDTNKSATAWLAVGLVIALAGRSAAPAQNSSIHDAQVDVTPSRDLSNTYFFFYYYAYGGSAGSSGGGPDVAVKRIGDLTANVPFSQAVELPSGATMSSVSYGLIGVNDAANGLVTLSLNEVTATMATNVPTFFEDLFPDWSESALSTALLNDDTNVLWSFCDQYSAYLTSYLVPGNGAGLISLTPYWQGGDPATNVGNISAAPVLTNHLSLEWRALAGGLEVSWPAAATSYWQLEVSRTLGSWEVVTDGIEVQGDNCYLYDPGTNPSAFYRLRRY